MRKFFSAMLDVTITNKENQKELFEEISSQDHELVLFCNDNATGLKAIIAVHNTTLGPSLGGIRMWPYASTREALTDVLRLSRGMTYKSAVAGLNLGGGKAVIIGDARKGKSEAMLRRLGQFINNLGGKYIAAEDVGMDEHDMEHIKLETSHVTGLPEYMGGTGDPSPVTAYGVYMGMKAAMKKQTGSDSMNGKSVLVQGVGTVGSALVDFLSKEGAKVSIFDIHEPSIQAVVKRTGASVVSADEVYNLPVDVYAPCALGGTLNPENIAALNCSIVAGAANNQLLDEQRDGQALVDRGILYAPDFVINAGGIINITQELEGNGYSRERAMKQTEKIFDTTLSIFDKAEKENMLVQAAAMEVAKDRIRAIGNNRLFR